MIMNLLLFSALCAVFGHSSGQNVTSDKFPPYYRVEVEMIRFENPNSVDLNNAWCDYTSRCDTSMSAYLDLDVPLRPFVSAAQAKVIFRHADVDSPTINMIVNKDVCGGATNSVTLRAYVYDNEPGAIWQTIDDIDCIFPTSPMLVADNAKKATWGPPTQCKAKYRNQDHRLFARVRAYKTDEATCHIDHAQLMELQSSKADTPPRPHTPGVHDFIKLDLELVQMNNPSGKTYGGTDCDSTSPCDPFFLVKLETWDALWKWPGVAGETGFNQVANVWDVNSPQLNKRLTRKVCGGALNWVNLRVEVKDGDPVAVFSDYTLIETFQCIFQFDYSVVASKEADAEWTPSLDCKPNHPPHDITLQYRYRAYDVDPKDC